MLLSYVGINVIEIMENHTNLKGNESYLESLGLGLFASLAFVLSFHSTKLIAFFKGEHKV